MITTKQNELHIINDFNDLIKDTKEKQKINKWVKKYSLEYFMQKVADRELEDNVKSYTDVFEELSRHYQNHAYLISKKIEEKIIDDYSSEEAYYDSYVIGSNDFTYKMEEGSFDAKGFQIAKKRKVLDRNKVGKDFEETVEENILNLVIEDYFKNLNKALEMYNFNNKIESLKNKDRKRITRTNRKEIEEIINRHLEGLYDYYISRGTNKSEILYSFKYNRDVIYFLIEIILNTIQEEIDIELSSDDIESMFNKERDMFEKKKTRRTKTNESIKIPLGWKAYAYTEFIKKIFK